MVEGELLAIWLHDQAAKLILGLQEPTRPQSRWAVLGKVMEPTPIGVWVDVQRFEEIRPATGAEKEKRVVWAVKPGQCVIRYDYIITVQRIKGAKKLPADLRVGFRAD